MGILRFTSAFTSLAVLFTPPTTYANTISSFEAEPVIACGVPPHEIVLDEEAKDQLFQSDPVVIPLIENPEILQTLTCIEAELPISRAQQDAAHIEVLSIGEDFREQFEAEANFLVAQIRVAGPKNAAVFKALLKGLQNRSKKTRSALIAVILKLEQAEIISEESS